MFAVAVAASLVGGEVACYENVRAIENIKFFHGSYFPQN